MVDDKSKPAENPFPSGYDTWTDLTDADIDALEIRLYYPGMRWDLSRDGLVRDPGRLCGLLIACLRQFNKSIGRTSRQGKPLPLIGDITKVCGDRREKWGKFLDGAIPGDSGPGPSFWFGKAWDMFEYVLLGSSGHRNISKDQQRRIDRMRELFLGHTRGGYPPFFAAAFAINGDLYKVNEAAARVRWLTQKKRQDSDPCNAGVYLVSGHSGFDELGRGGTPRDWGKAIIDAMIAGVEVYLAYRAPAIGSTPAAVTAAQFRDIVARVIGADHPANRNLHLVGLNPAKRKTDKDSDPGTFWAAQFCQPFGMYMSLGYSYQGRQGESLLYHVTETDNAPFAYETSARQAEVFDRWRALFL